MRGKHLPPPPHCAHFTGSYVGKCRAGVAYDSVRDQDRRDQMARFPCDRSLNSFTTCNREHFVPIVKIRRRIDVSDKNWKRAIIFTPDEGEPVRGQLVGCSDDQATAFIRIRPTPKRTRVIAVPTEQCHFARRQHRQPAPAAETETRGTVELPLFDLREVPATGRRRARELKVDQAA